MTTTAETPRARWKTCKISPDVHRVTKSLVALLPDEDLTEFINSAVIERLEHRFGVSRVQELLHDEEPQHGATAQRSPHPSSRNVKAG